MDDVGLDGISPDAEGEIPFLKRSVCNTSMLRDETYGIPIGFFESFHSFLVLCSPIVGIFFCERNAYWPHIGFWFV